MKSNGKKVVRSTTTYLKEGSLDKGVHVWTSDPGAEHNNQYNQVGEKEMTLDVLETEIKIDYTSEKYLA